MEAEMYATGVHYKEDGRLMFATAELEVVLCAGVFGSPQILELSGIGRRSVLLRRVLGACLTLQARAVRFSDI